MWGQHAARARTVAPIVVMPGYARPTLETAGTWSLDHLALHTEAVLPLATGGVEVTQAGGTAAWLCAVGWTLSTTLTWQPGEYPCCKDCVDQPLVSCHTQFQDPVVHTRECPSVSDWVVYVPVLVKARLLDDPLALGWVSVCIPLRNSLSATLSRGEGASTVTGACITVAGAGWFWRGGGNNYCPSYP